MPTNSPLPQESNQSLDLIKERTVTESRPLDWLTVNNWAAAICFHIALPGEVLSRLRTETKR